jgi:hypothetical protein
LYGKIGVVPDFSVVPRPPVPGMVLNTQFYIKAKAVRVP